MLSRRTFQLILGGYVLYAVFLLVSFCCLPGTINEVLSLPVSLPEIRPHLLPLNIGVVTVVLMLLAGRLVKGGWLIRLFSLGRGPREQSSRSWFTERRSTVKAVPTGAIAVALLATVLTPALLLFAHRTPAVSSTLWDDHVIAFKEGLAFKVRQQNAPSTLASPDRPKDSLPHTQLPVMHMELPSVSRFELKMAMPRLKEGFNHETTFSIFAKGTEQWPYVPAFFSHDGNRYPVNVRFRGWNFDHYLGFKKSWRIRFHKNDLFHGRRQFNVINQRDHSAINDILWSEALRESGIMTPYQFLVHLRMDEQFQGIQTFLEQPDRYFAERHNRNESHLYGESKPVVHVDEFTDPATWQQYARAGISNNLAPLIRLYQTALAKDHPDYLERMDNLLDIDHYLKYLAHATITCAENPSSHNIRWICDPGVGRFQILPWYQASSFFILQGHRELWRKHGWKIHPPATAINDFADGLLRHPRPRQLYLRHLWRMLQSTHHRDHLRRKLDELYHYVRADARADTHMHYRSDMVRYISNAEWETTIKRLRELVDSRLQYLEQQIIGAPVRADLKTVGPTSSDVLASLSLVSTNYSDGQLRRIELSVPADWAGRRLTLSHAGHVSTATVVRDQERGRVEFEPDIVLTSTAKRTNVLLGPGIIIADLGVVPNPEMNFLGGVSRLTPHYRPQAVTNTFLISGQATEEPNALHLAGISIRNQVTGRPMPVDGFHNSSFDAPPQYSAKAARLLQSLPFANPRHPAATLEHVEPDGVSLGENRLDGSVHHLPAGVHEFTENLVFGPQTLVRIAAGARLQFAAGKSLIVRGGLIAEGTEENPIIFTSRKRDGHWGSLFLNSNQRFTNRLTRCIIERSANVAINDLPVTAGLAAYSAPVEIRHCVFRDMASDDAFNSKYVSPLVLSCIFSNNLDAIDIDMGGGRVAGCLFLNNRDDCIDLSSSWAHIEGNRIHSHGDKGVSVGEKSRPIIFNNLITDATMGIAVKDLSTALILNNTLVSNATAIASYQKKTSFGPAVAKAVNNLIHFNGRPIHTDEESTVAAEYNSASIQLLGHGNILLPPVLEPGTLRLLRTKKLFTSGSGRPPSYYGLPGQKPLRRIGHLHRHAFEFEIASHRVPLAAGLTMLESANDP